MDDYSSNLAQLNTILADISASRDQPLDKVGNLYRQATEAICKAVILSAGEVPSGDLDKMISEAYKVVSKREPSRDAQQFRNELRYLQGTGNTFSHVGSTGDAALNKQHAARECLNKVLRLAFFSNGELDPPTLPADFKRGLPSRALQSDRLENLRPEEVVRIWHPMWTVRTRIRQDNYGLRLLYDYVEAVSDGVTFGVLFLRTRCNIDRCLTDCFQVLGESLPSSIHIVIPRAHRPNGAERDHRGHIQATLHQRFKRHETLARVEYFDEFVWNHCLPSRLRSAPTAQQPSDKIIPQSVQMLREDGQTSPAFPAARYIDSVLKQPQNHDPVQVIIGPAGIGKTTFCDGIGRQISAQERKRVVLLSATDFREVSNPPTIRSVSDLYRLAVDEGFMDEDESIASPNFEINLGCGNYVLIIDGFDELESHLGEALNFEEFMRSLTDLETQFRKVLVILTVRDYEKERFLNLPLTSIVQLRGFDGDDTERYLGKHHLNVDQINEARQLLRSFSSGADDALTVPLYASLICDYIIERSEGAASQMVLASDDAKWFAIDNPLDRLVRKIVDREIAKQSLADLKADDFFDILIEVIRAPKSGLSKEDLAEHVEMCGGDATAVTAANFMRNPFLRFNNDTFWFKYDSLAYFFKSRLLVRRLQEGQFRPSPTIEFMTEMARGDGPLLDELNRIFPAKEHATDDSVAHWFNGLMAGWRADRSGLQWRKAISGFIYWLVHSEPDKPDRTSAICQLFDGLLWEGFSIFGKFHPLNLRGVHVTDGHIENYTCLVSCDVDPSVPVFHNTYVDFDDRSVPEKLDRGLFDSSCRFSSNLQSAFEAKDLANELSQEMIRDNVYKLLKVGFKGNRFTWKSELLYRKVTVVGRHSRDVYLRTLVERGVLREEAANTGPERGFTVVEAWYGDVRKLIEERNVSTRMFHVMQQFGT